MHEAATRRLLVVEDNQGLIANLFAYFEARRYSIDIARDGRAGLQLALNQTYDAIVVDWMLPRLDGKEMLNQLRDAGCEAPALMLTARTELQDKLQGFQAGADDYLTKPFALAELEARIEALLKRSRARSRVLQVADLRFDLATQEVTRDGRALQLYAAPKKLLALLMKSSPLLVTRERLEAALWGDSPPDRDVLRTHIYELRKSVDGPFRVKLIQTLPKLGYRIRSESA